MRRTSLAFFLALVVSSSILSRPGQQTIQTNSDDALFITANLDWQKPPAKVHHSYKTSVASVLLFHPSGELEEVTSLCQRDANGAVTIDLKGGYTIRKGNWKTTDDRSVDVKTRLIYTSSPRVNSTGNGAKEEKTCRLKDSDQLATARRIACGSSTFNRTSTLRNVDELNKTIKFHAEAAAK